MKRRPDNTGHNSPRGIHIHADETLSKDPETIAIDSPLRHMSTVEALTNLTAVKHAKDIGKSGPSNAAGSREANKDDADFNKYNVFFPRDGHVVAELIFDLHPELTRTTVIASFEKMGVIDNYTNPTKPFDEQEIGKIPHEIRSPDDPLAINLTEKKNWGWPYYGAIDTTGKNIIAISRLVNHPDYGTDFLDETYKGRDDKTHAVLHGLEQNIAWLTGRMDKNPEGLVESLAKNPLHHANQTWADSPEAFHHADGSWAEHHPESNLGVAAVEQQAEAYDALLGAATIYETLGRTDEASVLRKRARKLQTVVLDKFWVTDKKHNGGYFARGTDRDTDGHLRPLAIRSSDMGHLLNSGILDDTDDPKQTNEIAHKRRAVIQNLFSPEMLCPSGIRTLSSDSLRYSDDRYHNGNSWPWTSYYIAKGLDRHGYHGLSHELKKRVWDNYNETKLLGEYASGSSDPDHRLINQKVTVHNESLTTDTEYPVSQPAQEIQAWTAAAIYAIKREYSNVVARKLGGLYLNKSSVNLHTNTGNNKKTAFETAVLRTIRQ
ncbi:MAG TPA: hypothetical protein VFM68_01470 [Candidatus Saccharimonadales bacterium]|nr:hypothetical protein [Candidatus Saccharimonadales bacterium]